MAQFLFTRLRCLLPYGLALLFALQVGAVIPLHHFHGAESHSSSEKPSLPEDCRCDLCFTISGLDHATAVAPPVAGLVETAFAVVAAYHYFTYSAPAYLPRVRGPPSFTA